MRNVTNISFPLRRRSDYPRNFWVRSQLNITNTVVVTSRTCETHPIDTSISSRRLNTVYLVIIFITVKVCFPHSRGMIFWRIWYRSFINLVHNFDRCLCLPCWKLPCSSIRLNLFVNNTRTFIDKHSGVWRN